MQMGVAAKARYARKNGFSSSQQVSRTRVSVTCSAVVWVIVGPSHLWCCLSICCPYLLVSHLCRLCNVCWFWCCAACCLKYESREIHENQCRFFSGSSSSKSSNEPTQHYADRKLFLQDDVSLKRVTRTNQTITSTRSWWSVVSQYFSCWLSQWSDKLRSTPAAIFLLKPRASKNSF